MCYSSFRPLFPIRSTEAPNSALSGIPACAYRPSPTPFLPFCLWQIGAVGAAVSTLINVAGQVIVGHAVVGTGTCT